MKKENLLGLINKLKDLSVCIVGNIYELKYLNGEVEERFLDFCDRHKNVINDQNFNSLIKIFNYLSEIEELDDQNDLFEILEDLFDNDYITSSESFNYIVKKILLIFDVTIADLIDELDLLNYNDISIKYNDYIITIFSNYVKLFSKLGNIPYTNMFNQDLEKVSDSYFELIYDLANTKGFKDETIYDLAVKRIMYFSDLMSDEKIYSLDPDKYLVILNVVSSLRNVQMLSRLKNNINCLENSLSYEDFGEKVENLNEDISENTINVLCSKLGIIKELTDDGHRLGIPEDVTNEEVSDVANKVLSNKIGKNVIIF